DHDKYRRLPRQRGIRPIIAERGVEHGSGLGVSRWVVERTIAWLHGFRQLRIRWERRDDIHEASLSLATCLITHRHVRRLN
ncbi:transposase, partial [Streptomyces collinus]|uniref:transposase n=1 Tax=Streptomyces collinus TaxID=42684 RepID=UPI0036BC6D12